MITSRSHWTAVKNLALVLLGTVLAYSQSIPPGQLRGARQPKGAKTRRLAALTAGTTPDPCSQLVLMSWFLPLTVKDSHRDEITDGTVQCFYQSPGTVSPVNQVGFLYGFGGGDSKTLSADLASVQFHGGLQASLGSSVTMGTSTTATQTTTTTGANGQQQDTTTLTQDTPGTAISKLQSGGDLYLRFNYPLLYKNGDRWGGVVFAQPRIGGNFSGFGSEATITEASEYNVNMSVEAYGEWRGIGSAGSLYADIRSGWQYIQPEVAQKLGLGDKNTFGMHQFAAGVEFAGLVRIGFQRFVGPAPAFGVTSSQLSKWHLVANLVPKKKQQQ